MRRARPRRDRPPARPPPPCRRRHRGTGPGRSPGKPASARRSHIAWNVSLRPHQAWSIRMPGPSSRGGAARYARPCSPDSSIHSRTIGPPPACLSAMRGRYRDVRSESARHSPPARPWRPPQVVPRTAASGGEGDQGARRCQEQALTVPTAGAGSLTREGPPSAGMRTNVVAFCPCIGPGTPLSAAMKRSSGLQHGCA